MRRNLEVADEQTEDLRAVKKRAVAEIKIQAQNMRGLLALADELDDVADLEKEAATLRAEIEALKEQQARLVGLQDKISEATVTLARINSEINATRARFG